MAFSPVMGKSVDFVIIDIANNDLDLPGPFKITPSG